MRLTKDLFKKFPGKDFLEISPLFKQKRAQVFTSLSFSLVALSLFGFFAINPTLSTITKLQRQLSDSRLVDKKLGEKIINLSLLREKYRLLESDIPLVLSAIPKSPNAPLLLGKIQSLAKESNLTVKKIQSLRVELNQSKDNLNNYSSFVFVLEAQASSYNDATNFLSSLINFDRLVNLDAVSITSAEGEEILNINIQGKAYFKN